MYTSFRSIMQGSTPYRGVGGWLEGTFRSRRMSNAHTPVTNENSESSLGKSIHGGINDVA